MSILYQFGLSVLGDGPVHDDRPIVDKRQKEIFYILSELLEPKIILEIGTWEGRSALSWADASSKYNTAIICVDTWLGSVEHYENKLAGSEWERSRIFLEDGYPSIYKTFVTNIRRNGFQDFVIAVPIDSHQAFIIFEKANIKPDICYIDASHDYDSVLADLRAAQKIGSNIICGDDYYYYDHSEVKSAVDFFAKENNMKVIEKQWQFILIRENQQEIYSFLKEKDWNDC
jgi:Methyltransferase domain